MNRRELFKSMNRYALYYGTGRAELLTRFDFIIVEPKGQSEEDIERLQQSDTLVIAYISVAEIRSDSNIFNLLKDEDFLHQNGQRMMNNTFSTYLLNLNSRRWMGLLHHQIGRYLLHSGYDGVFLDTIGDVERTDLSASTQTEQLNAAVKFVAQLREYFPEHVIIQNNGLELLCHSTFPYLDALLWENPPFLSEGSQDWVERITQQLKMYKQNHGLKILILQENNGQSTEDERSCFVASHFSDEHAFPLYISPSNYTMAVNIEEEVGESSYKTQPIEKELVEEKELTETQSEVQALGSTKTPLDEYFTVLMQQLKWMKHHSHPSEFEKTIKDYLLTALPDQYHYTVAMMLIELYEKSGEKNKLKQLLPELISRYQNHPFLNDLLQSYLSQLT